MSADWQQIQEVKDKVSIIQKNYNLRCYRDGFLFHFEQVYVTSQVLLSGQVVKDTSNSLVALTSYIPLVGS